MASKLNSKQTFNPWLVARNLGQNPIVLFTASRYVGYVLQFVRGILVARFLGPYLFGIWGFLTLVQQYLMYSSLGFQYAINVELAVNALSDKERQTKYIGAAATMTFLIAIFLAVVGAFIQFNQIAIFEKYNFSRYAFAVSLIVGLTHLKELFTNIYRVYNQLVRIMIAELLLAFVPLLVVFFYRDEALVIALLVAMSVSTFLAVGLFSIKAPFPLQPQINLPLARHMLAIGIPLLVYNLSYGLITIAGRTVVSAFYSVEALGFFTLANSITTATLLGLRAVTWVVFPSILTKTRDELPDDLVRQTVNKVNELYSTAVFLVVFVMILLSPLLTLILPQYEPVINILTILLLMQAVLSVIFGYNTIAIARNKQLKVAVISIAAVLFITFISLFIAWMAWDVFWIAIAMLAGSLLFVLFQAQLGSRLVNSGRLQPDYLTTVLPTGSLLAMCIYLLGSLLNQILFFGVAGLLLFVITRRSSLQKLWDFAWQKSQLA